MASLVESLGGILRLAAGNVVVAAILLLVGVIIARLLERLVHYLLKLLELNKNLMKAGLPFALEETIAHLVKYVLYFITIVVTLNQLGITTQVFNIVAAVVIGVVIISMFLGLKDFVPNYWAGIFLYRRHVYAVGDTIEINGIEGQVVKFDVLETTVRTSRGDMLYLPSSLMLHSQILKKKR